MGEFKIDRSSTLNEVEVTMSVSTEAKEEKFDFGGFLSLKYIIGVVAVVMTVVAFGYSHFSKKNSAETLLKNYFNARTWEERLKYVRNPETVKPLMSEYYKRTDLSGGHSFLKLKMEDGIKPQNLKIGEFINVRVVFGEETNALGGTVQDAWWYVLFLTDSGFKIDWEASVVYNPMTFKALAAQRPTHSQKFRLLAELGDYYNYEFERPSLYSINLTEYGSSEYTHGYIEKDSMDGKRLYEILKDGQKHPVILNIRYPIYSRGSRQVIIDQFLKEGFSE